MKYSDFNIVIIGNSDFVKALAKGFLNQGFPSSAVTAIFPEGEEVKEEVLKFFHEKQVGLTYELAYVAKATHIVLAFKESATDELIGNIIYGLSRVKISREACYEIISFVPKHRLTEVSVCCAFGEKGGPKQGYTLIYAVCKNGNISGDKISIFDNFATTNKIDWQ